MPRKTTTEKQPRLVPALRGIFGTWVYYTAMLPLKEVAAYVKVADEIHESKKLSDMIQRELKKGRAAEIAKYLSTKERFFNSLVVAVYGGEPQWFSLSSLDATPEGFDASAIGDDDLAKIGFLSLSGKERCFALDGQHRLAGIRKALETSPDCAEDEINLIFVSHEESVPGRQRTRRLFTTLNKRAKPVSKGAIIALDEDDTMAIVCRRLVEEHQWFGGERVAYQATNNMPPTNKEAFTTLGALYDSLGSLFCGIYGGSREKLRYFRPDDDDLDEWYQTTVSFFQHVYESFESFQLFCDADDAFADVTANQRHGDGGSVLFRPIGLNILVEVLVKLSKAHEGDVDVLIPHIAGLDWRLESAPFVNVIWDTQAKRMMTGSKTLCRDLVLYMLGEQGQKSSLAHKYAKAKGISNKAANEFLESLNCLEAISE